MWSEDPMTPSSPDQRAAAISVASPTMATAQT
jgi:hypothetical protein